MGAKESRDERFETRFRKWHMWRPVWSVCVLEPVGDLIITRDAGCMHYKVI